MRLAVPQTSGSTKVSMRERWYWFRKSAPANGRVKARLGGAPLNVWPNESEVNVKAGDVLASTEWLVYPTELGEYDIDARVVYQPTSLTGQPGRYELSAISPPVHLSIRDSFGFTATQEDIAKCFTALGVLTFISQLLVRLSRFLLPDKTEIDA